MHRHWHGAALGRTCSSKGYRFFGFEGNGDRHGDAYMYTIEEKMARWVVGIHRDHGTVIFTGANRDASY